MAIVFISPKRRQKMFFIGITVMFLFLLSLMSLGVFFSKPKEVSTVLVFNKPKVDINMKVFESDQFKNLQPFSQMQIQYKYTAIAKDKKPTEGYISSLSMEQAKTELEKQGLTGVIVKEEGIGRNNPFASYYQVIATPLNQDTVDNPQ